jgi:23S rRNA (cytidine1920-2'-O)/16S rRNA (cytidine1409-2'-O)-methyltransferase
MSEERLDIFLVKNKLVSSRVRAEELIKKSGVLVDGKLCTKPGKKVLVTSEIKLIEEEIPWVSRGALKLLKAIEHWDINFKDKIVLDIGASTGGFSEVALKFGAKKTYCVEVGKDQLHETLKSDQRVINLEKTHVRELNSNVITDEIDISVIDVSFISLKKIFPFIHPFIKSNGKIIALVKPQFEVGKQNLNKKGIVKNIHLYPVILEEIKSEALKSNMLSIEHIESPILGGDGNLEFLLFLEKK